MSDFTICGVDPSALPGSRLGFVRVIALGYSDGPTSGLAQCTDGDAVRFELLAIDVDGVRDRDAWDAGEELRVFSLARVPTGTFERLVELLDPSEPPAWPVWVLPGDNEPQTESRLRRRIDELLALAEAPAVVICVRDLLGVVLAARPVTEGDIAAADEWFTRLGW